ncbi:MAG: septum site-determining protein Ssd [Streptosporangiaceae bacterium]
MAPPRPLLVTDDAALLDDVLRLAAAADVEIEVAHAAALGSGSWASAPLVLVGADLATQVVRRRLPRRRGVVLVGTDLDDEDIWRQAVAVGAERVVFLPDAEAWLVDRLADVEEGGESRATVVCVVGGRGGAGASTFAVALAVTGTRMDRRTLLVDADPLGGGIDLLLGGEGAEGSRWPDLLGTKGRVRGGALRGALPRIDELTVLSWGRSDVLTIPREAMRSILSAAERASDLVVVDLPRRLDSAAEEAIRCSAATLLLVPAELRATVSASRVAAEVGAHAADLRVVVRGPAPSGLSGEVIAESLGLPLGGEMRAEPGLAGALERGEAPARRGRGPLAELCASFLVDLQDTTGSEAA